MDGGWFIRIILGFIIVVVVNIFVVWGRENFH